MSSTPRGAWIRVLLVVCTLPYVFAVAGLWAIDRSGQDGRLTLVSLAITYLLFWGVCLLWTSAPRTEAAGRFILTTLSLGFAIGLFEGLALLRLVDYRMVFGTPIDEPWRHPMNRLDPELLHIQPPYQRFEWAGIEYRYDQHGLRNATDLDNAAVVVLGDSFVEGWNVTGADLFTSHLARELGQPVANAGQSWYGPQQELALLERVGVRLRPQVCIWSFFEGNDLQDLRRYQRATADWPGFAARLHSFPERSFAKNATSALERLVQRARDGKRSLPDGYRGTVTGAVGEPFDMYFSYRGHYLSDDELAALREVADILADADALCRSHGAALLVAFVPTKFRVYRDLTTFDAHSLARYWVVNDMPDQLEQLVRERLPGAAFLDLTRPLADAARRGHLVYFADDTHWSAEGHRAAAIALAEVVRPLLGGCERCPPVPRHASAPPPATWTAAPPSK